VIASNGAMSQTQVDIDAGNDTGVTSGAMSGPEMAFIGPGNGKRVTGTVALSLNARGHDGQNPYVTFYVDKQFKTLKNYPPYTYEWDTTQVPNGVHTIEATGYLDSSDVSTNCRLKVFVDNPGGNTVRMREIPDLRKAAPKSAAVAAVGAPAVANAKSAAPKTVAQAVLPVPQTQPLSSRDSLHNVIAGQSRPAAEAASVMAVMPSVTGVAPSTGTALPGYQVNSVNAVVPAAAANTPTTTQAVAPAITGEHETVGGVVATDAPSISSVMDRHLTGPRVPAANMTAPIATRTAAPIASAIVTHHAVSSTAATSMAVPNAAAARAAETVSTSASAVVNSTQAAFRADGITAMRRAVVLHATTFGMAPARPANHVRAAMAAHHIRISAMAPRASVLPAAHAMALSNPSLLQVAFDGTQIAFDVAPRVEAGLPIAPFRQIFEHTGGQVDWVSGSQVVHAVNHDREIVIRVGQRSATVNGESIQMDRAAFVERGRTIVPLSFVGKALDVDVKYDPATGRLQITSK